MDVLDFKKNYNSGNISKKMYYRLMREYFTHHIVDLSKLLNDSEYCESIILKKDQAILERKDGTKLFFDFSQSICRAEMSLLSDGEQETLDIEIINNYLDRQKKEYGSKVMGIMDIGANVGQVTVHLYKRNPDFVYNLFEPVPATYEMLKRTMVLNGMDRENIKCHNLGISDKKDKLKFFVPSTNEAASLVANYDELYSNNVDSDGLYSDNHEIKEIMCDVTTLDDFVNNNPVPRIVFIKIDVEGNEKYVLKGAIETIKKNRPLIYSELLRKHAARFGYHPNEVIKFMKDLDYRCAITRNGILESIESIDENTEETNFFFIPQEMNL